MIESGDNFDYKAIAIIALEAHTSVSARTVTIVDGANAIAPASAQFIAT